VQQALHAFPDRQHAADREDAERGQQRPVEQLGAVPEGMTGVRLAPGPAQAGEQQQLVAGVGQRVQRLGEQRGRAGQRGRGRLGREHRQVGTHGDGDRAQALTAARALRGVVPPDRRPVAAGARLQHGQAPPQQGQDVSGRRGR
jgi:hypothetical protein